MKNINPGSVGAGWRFAMLPFKAYIIGAFCVLIALLAWSVFDWKSSPLNDNPGWSYVYGRAGDFAILMYGCLVCVITLALGGTIAAFHSHDRKAMRSALAYAVAALLLAVVLAPLAFPPAIK